MKQEKQEKQQHAFFNFDDNDPDPQGLLGNTDDVDLPFFWDLDDQSGTAAVASNIDALSKTNASTGYTQVLVPTLPQVQQLCSLPQYQLNQQEQQVPAHQQQTMISPAPTQFNSTSNSEVTPSSFLSDLAQQIAAGRKGIAGSDDNEKCVTDTSTSFNLCPNILIPPQQQQTSSAAMATTATTQGQQGDNSNFQQTVVNTSSWNASQQANAHNEQHMNQLMNSVTILPKFGVQQTQLAKTPGPGISSSSTTSGNVQQGVPDQRQLQHTQQNQFFALPPPPTQLRPSQTALGFSQLQSDSQQQPQQSMQFIQQLQQQQQYDMNKVFTLGKATTGNHSNMLPPQQQIPVRKSQQQGHALLPYGSQIIPISQARPSTDQDGNNKGTTSPSPILISQQTPVSTETKKNCNINTRYTRNSTPSIISRKRQLQNELTIEPTPPATNIANKKVIVSCSDTEGEPQPLSPAASSPRVSVPKRLQKSSKILRSSSNSDSMNGKKDGNFSQEEKMQQYNTDTFPSSASSIHNAMTVAPSVYSSSTKVNKESSNLSVKDANRKLSSGNLSADGSSITGDTILDEEMTEKERALANRLRNREHARNTRARKKAYLESLKSTLDELCRERDTLVSERAGAASLLLEMQKTRTDVLLSFFAVRSCYEKRRTLWSSILDESVTCVMPVTPYRSFPASEVQVSKCQRTILGVDGIIADTASLHVLLNSLVDRSKHPDGVIRFRYTLIAEEAVVSGNQMMARWNMSTLNAKGLGAKREVAKMGMLCARFNSAHKIVSIDLMFDVMAFMLQLKQSAGSSAFSVVPNTVQTCVGPFGNKPTVMTSAERPYTIVQVNRRWEEMTGWKAEDVVGKVSCKILQGKCTERTLLMELMSNIRYKRSTSAILTNYTRGRRRLFRNFINCYPLSTDSKISHYLALTVHFEWLESKLLLSGEESLTNIKDDKKTVNKKPAGGRIDDSSDVKKEEKDES